MANRFPLILDTTDGNKIKEIPSGDNLDLRNVSIVDAQNIDALGTINAAGIKINGADVQPGEFTDLDDTPSTLSGSEGLFVRVKADGTGLEFYELGGAEAELNITNLQVSQSILPDVDVGATIGNPTSRFDGIYGNFFQGSVKDNTGSTVFDAATGKIPYAAIVGAPNLISDLDNDEGYIKATELRAVIPTFIEDGLVEVEVKNTGDLVGSVIGEDSTVLVDSLTSRINAARLTQNGANNGQTLVWDEATQVWVPGIAGDITGFASNKVDLLTVETGYKITFQDATGTIAADTIQLDTTVSTEVNNVKVRSNSNIYPDTDNTSNIGIVGNTFANGYINNIVATTIAGDLTGNAVGETHKANTGVFGDNTGVAGAYKLHVIGDLGVTTGNLDLNGGSIIGANFEDATGNFRGSFFGDDSTIIVDGTDNSITGNLKFPGATGTIEGTIIELTASNRIEATDIQTTGNFFPRFNESGAIGTVARKFDEGNFVTLRADAFNIDTITASTINTENFVLSGTGTGTLVSNTDLELQSGNRTKVTGGTFQFPELTQAEVDNVVLQNADTMYNSDTNKFEFRENGSIIQLHIGTFTGIHKGNVQGLDGTSIFNGSTNKITTPTVIGTATFEEDVVIGGDLTVSGTTTTVNTEEVNIADNIILLNSNFTGPTPTESGGIEIERGDEDNKQFVWNESTDKWSIGAETLVAGTVEATFTGDLTGNTVGFHTGDITGSVFGDDSTPLVDAVNNVISGDIDTTSLKVTSLEIAIGLNSGGSANAFQVAQSAEAIAIGKEAGRTGQGQTSIAVGSAAGNTNQGQQAIAIGKSTGGTSQGTDAIAIGTTAGGFNQGTDAIAIGQEAGGEDQSGYAIAIGNQAGNLTQGTSSIAIGNQAGETTQGFSSVAVGDMAGQTSQGDNAVAVGRRAQFTGGGEYAVAIGINAGYTGQGESAVAIGHDAGQTNQAANSIVINATGVETNNTTASSLVIKPIRNAASANVMMYDDTSGEVTHTATPGTLAADIDQAAIAIGAATATTIEIGNVGSTTAFAGTVSLPSVAGTIAADIRGSIFGDDSSLLVDGVAGKIVGDIDNNSIQSTTITAGKFVGPISRIVGDVQDISGPGAISLDTLVTEITTTGADAYTLADGVLGQVKIISMIVYGGDATITPTTFATGTTITMADVNDNITLLYTTNGWVNTANQGSVVA